MAEIKFSPLKLSDITIPPDKYYIDYLGNPNIGWATWTSLNHNKGRTYDFFLVKENNKIVSIAVMNNGVNQCQASAGVAGGEGADRHVYIYGVYLPGHT